MKKKRERVCNRVRENESESETDRQLDSQIGKETGECNRAIKVKEMMIVTLRRRYIIYVQRERICETDEDTDRKIGRESQSGRGVEWFKRGSTRIVRDEEQYRQRQ